MTPEQEALDDVRLALGRANAEIKMLKAALNNRDVEIARLNALLTHTPEPSGTPQTPPASPAA